MKWFNLAAWRRYAIARITELEAQEKYLSTVIGADPKAELLKGVRSNLGTARRAASGGFNLITGSAREATWNNIHEAEVTLAELAQPDQLRGVGLNAIALAREHLARTDARRIALEGKLNPSQPEDLKQEDLSIAVQALRAAYEVNSSTKRQARTFNNMVLLGFLVLVVIAAGLVVFGLARQDVLDLCFPTVPNKGGICPAGQNHPTGYDILIVETFGLTAAALTSAVALSKLDGTSTPYAIPRSLALLKLPAGALSSVLGLTLLTAGLVPGFSTLRDQGQILAWAAIFGVAQQALTRFVDAKGQAVLDHVREPGMEVGRASDSY